LPRRAASFSARADHALRWACIAACLLAAPVSLAFIGSLAARAQDYSQDPIPEPPVQNDILPPADDTEPDAMLDDEPDTGPERVPRPPPEVFPPSNLRIASWDLSEAPHLMPPPQAASQAPTWRTTFGSERRTEAETSPIPASQAMSIDADVVLLQGVSDVAVLRRLFQPRNWRLVVSRRVLPTGTTGAAYAGPTLNTAMPVRVTAIAVKAKRGLRITGREHILDLARAEDAAAGATAPSATVVRIADGTRLIWLLSVALPDACSSKGAECPAQQRIADWQQSKLGAGQGTVVGGRFGHAAPAGTSSAACSHQEISTDLRRTEPSPRSQGTQRQGAGCVALVELPAQ
jgi:hypothetical protein